MDKYLDIAGHFNKIGISLVPQQNLGKLHLCSKSHGKPEMWVRAHFVDHKSLGKLCVLTGYDLPMAELHSTVCECITNILDNGEYDIPMSLMHAGADILKSALQRLVTDESSLVCGVAMPYKFPIVATSRWRFTGVTDNVDFQMAVACDGPIAVTLEGIAAQNENFWVNLRKNR